LHSYKAIRTGCLQLLLPCQSRKCQTPGVLRQSRRITYWI